MTSTTNPKVSVVMPVYNAEKFLRESIDSILRQTYEDFELIIINDGSNDRSKYIIDHYAKQDSRIVSINQTNHGVVYSANKAIEMARGEYIARMDADDVSFPDRLRQEVNILDSHPGTVLVCSSFEIFDEQGEYRYREIVLPDNAAIQRALYLRNPIANGSTMIRKKSLIKAGLFDEIFAEDFHMWMKLAKLGDFEATGTVLYRWRMNPNGLTLTNNGLSIDQGKQYMADRWKAIPPQPLNRRDIMNVIKTYQTTYKKHTRAYTWMALTDISQLAAKLVINGNYIAGIKQLIALATTGGLGLRIALQRIHLVGVGHYGKLRRRIPFGRAAYDNTAEN